MKTRRLAVRITNLWCVKRSRKAATTGMIFIDEKVLVLLLHDVLFLYGLDVVGLHVLIHVVFLLVTQGDKIHAMVQHFDFDK